jgi:hypothetical protein
MDGQRATYRQYEGDYYSDTRTELSKQAAPGRFGTEDQHNVQDGVEARTQQAASNYSVTQGQHLLEDQALRGDAPAPDANYASHEHQDLYNMVHTDMDPTDLDAKGRVANAIGNWLAELSNSIAAVTQTSGVSWQGAAADQAHGFFQQTANYTAQTANAAQLNSNRYSQQSAAADYAQKNMPEPTGFNQQAEMQKVTQQLNGGNPLTAAVAMNQLSEKQQKADAAHQQAVQVLHGLDNTYHETSTTQPTYSAPPQMNSDSTHASSAAPITAPGGSVSSGPYSGPGGSGFSAAAPPPAGSAGNATFTPPPPVSGSGGSAPLPGPGINTGAGAFNNPTGGGAGFRGSATPGGLGGRLSPDALSMGGGNLGNAGESTPRSRPGIGTGRSGGGFAGSRVSGGGAGGKGSSSAPGEGEASGKGKSGALERGAKSAAEAAKTGKPGAAAGAAGSGKKKEEDKEHKNKIPTQIDPEEVFEVRPERGPDGEKITPPVIGG